MVKQACWKVVRSVFIVLFCAALLCLVLAFSCDNASSRDKAVLTAATALCFFLLMRSSSHISPRIATDDMTGPEFEQYCALVLRKAGFTHIRSTPATGDYGADLIARDRRGQRWVFQCKRYSGKVGNSAVQEVVAAKAHYDADCAGVMTNSELTGNARRLADENGVMCMEGIS